MGLPHSRQPLLIALAIVMLLSAGPAPERPLTAQAVADPGPLTLLWSAAESANTASLAWGDYDGDGDLDLAVGNAQQPTRIYRNDGGQVGTRAVWATSETFTTQAVAWGDVDGDGDLDLALGNYTQPSRLYRNTDGQLLFDAAWAPSISYTQSMAWGDVDGDGDLDLALGNGCKKFDTSICTPSAVYRTTNGTLDSSPSWTSAEASSTLSIAWGDLNQDGYLDLAIAAGEGVVRLYQGNGTALTASATWSAQLDGAATSVAWGDVDNDGDLDLAIGTARAKNRIYRNDAGILSVAPVWQSSDSPETRSLAWGDYDSDGDLDLLAGNGGQQSETDAIYRNEFGTLQPAPAWRSSLADRTAVVAWGDVDNDGDLDFAGGNLQGPSRIYRNDLGTVQPVAWWSAPITDQIYGIAWGDVDADSDLDLVAASVFGPNRLYRNEEGSLTLAWSSTDQNYARGLALGDYDGDGDLDLAVAETVYGSSKVYANIGGTFATSPVWSAPDTDRASSVAWGDVDGDSDLDLAVGTFSTIDVPEGGQVNRIYRNNGGGRFTQLWASVEQDMTFAVAWGDVDNDGDLDLAVGNGCPAFSLICTPNRLYRNDRGTITADAVWSSTERDQTTAVAWGDVDGDGDLDLAVANSDQPSRVYRNDGGKLTTDAVWSSIESAPASSVAWADVDGDGDLDLSLGSFGQPSRLYRNDSGSLTPMATWSSVATDTVTSIAWGDIDGDGDLDLATGNRDQPVRVYQNMRDQRASPASIPTVRLQYPAPPDPGTGTPLPILSDGTVAITYTLTHPQRLPVAEVEGFYSLDGGGRWLPALPTSDTQTRNLATAANATTDLEGTHVYRWDVFGSGVMGQSDLVIFRLVARPAVSSLPAPAPIGFRYGAFAAQTSLLRVRGTQVRVYRGQVAAGNEAAGAIVYRIPATTSLGGAPLGSADGIPFQTDGQGYLQGRASLAVGDQIVALLPSSTSQTSTLYETSAIPTTSGLATDRVASQGTQVLRVSAANSLRLFNLDVSVEWDARRDTLYLAQLERDLRRTSDLLYDWTNGQVALGSVRVFLNRERWEQAHIRIAASNQIRPTANQGGIVTQPITDPVSLNGPITYAPGHVTIGAVWNRYGEASGVIGEDWPRALAHELGHYLLFLDDNYLGLDPQGLLIPVDTCPGAMSDPYRPDYSEFYPRQGWGTSDGHPGCLQTLSHQTTGRADWSTITSFYPELKEPEGRFDNVNPGPTTRPLDVTRVIIIPPSTEATPLEVPTFNLVDAASSGRVQPGAGARAALFQPDRRQVIDLGQPILDRVDARGARQGDRLCIYDLAEGRLGCATVIATDQQIPLTTFSATTWRPEVRITPVTPGRFKVTITNVPPGLALQAQMFPEIGAATEPTALTADSAGYTDDIVLSQPSFEGYIHIWVDEPEPRREVLVAFSVGGGPGHVRSRKAPLVSPNGQVILYSENIQPTSGMYTLQTASALPSPPPWATVVGQGVVLAGSADAPAFDRASISFNYLGSDVPPGGEEWLRVYFWDGGVWTPLRTTRNSYHNIAAAPVADTGPGLYALMSSVELPLDPGWNLLAYPLQRTQPVATALASIAGAYSTVYGYLPAESGNFWRVYAPDAPKWLLDDPSVALRTFAFGEAYWIYMKESRVWFPGRIDAQAAGVGAQLASTPPNLPNPPATFYGRVLPRVTVAQQAGLVVRAFMNGRQCGEGTTRVEGSDLVYIVHVLSSDEVGESACGSPGTKITFTVDGVSTSTSATWSNGEVRELDLVPVAAPLVYLPYVVR